MKYQEACAALKRAARLGSRPGLANITRLCALMGDPQDKLKIIHVAGTNGKGSTCAMLAGIGRAAGYRTGFFSSPFFEDYRESISINGRSISKAGFTQTAEDVLSCARIMEAEGTPPTEYELLAACAFLWFSRQKCGLVVLETCMGGRLDVTNVIKNPLACVICAISLDHTAFLGDNVLSIAAEKCGIIKEGCIVIAYPIQPPGVMELIEKTAREKGCPLAVPGTDAIEINRNSLLGTAFSFRNTQFQTAMPGEHQVLNAAVAIECARALYIAEDAIKAGLKEARLPARQEVFSSDPLILLDGAHNPQGIQALAATVMAHLSGRRIVAVMGMLSDKDYGSSVAVMARVSSVWIATEPKNPRALSARAIAREAQKILKDVSAEPRIEDALANAIGACGPDGAIVVCGSLYLALEARRILESKNQLHTQV